MRLLLLLMSFICISLLKAQDPSGMPVQVFTGKWYQYKQYIEADSGILMVSRDTNFVPRQPILIFRLQPGVDTSFYAYNGMKWVRQLNTRDLATALSGTVTRGDSLVVFATPTSAKRYSDSLYNRSVKYTDSTTKYVTPAQGAALYYPRTGNPSGFLTTNQTITLTGDVSGSGKTTISVSVNRFGGQLPTYYLDRANHIGVQSINTITGLPSSLDSIRKSFDSVYYAGGSLTFKRIDGNIFTVNIDSAGVVSFNGRTGAVMPLLGDYITDSIPEGIKKYYTDSLARAAFNSTSPIQYNNSNGNISITQASGVSNGYLSIADWNAFNAKLSGIDTLSLSNRINNKVDTIYNDITGDSIKFSINGRIHVIQGAGVNNLQEVTDIGNSTTKNVIAASFVATKPNAVLQLGNRYALQNQDLVDSAFRLHDLLTDSTRLYINKYGWLGINNMSPSATLDVTGNISSSDTIKARKRFIAGTLTPTAIADYYAGEVITDHAHYGFLDNSQVTYSGIGTQARAAYNDNTNYYGMANSDHAHSFQSYPHWGSTGILNRLSGFWMQPDVTAGVVTELSEFRASNPLGSGGITNLYGVYIPTLNRGTTNYGIYVEPGMPNFFGGNITATGTFINRNDGQVIANNHNAITSIYSNAAQGVRIGYNTTNGNGFIMPVEGIGNGLDISTYNAGVLSPKLTILNNGVINTNGGTILGKTEMAKDSSIRVSSTEYTDKAVYTAIKAYWDSITIKNYIAASATDTLQYTGIEGATTIASNRMVNSVILSVSRDGIGQDIITGIPGVGQASYTAATGLITLGEYAGGGEKIKVIFRKQISGYASLVNNTIVVNTYAAMLSEFGGSNSKLFIVLNDETSGNQKSAYMYAPGGTSVPAQLVIDFKN